jgi:hypothetical protein
VRTNATRIARRARFGQIPSRSERRGCRGISLDRQAAADQFEKNREIAYGVRINDVQHTGGAGSAVGNSVLALGSTPGLRLWLRSRQ